MLSVPPLPTDSLSPRRRSGERVRERGVGRGEGGGPPNPVANALHKPLSSTLSPLVPRGEREPARALVVSARCPPTLAGWHRRLYSPHGRDRSEAHTSELQSRQ